ncbi:MAG: methyltransferase [Gammaproteobacteria bacterium]|nr:MAG: methyltransferase [Gammaproteobacteria bacterium]
MIRIKTCLLAACMTLASFTHSTHARDSNDALTLAIDSRSEESRARDGARHPAQTIAFFQIEPGMTVAEGLPGGGWYTQILANYLGREGGIYGINYSEDLWPLFERSDKWVAEHAERTATFPAMVEGFSDNGIAIESFTFSTVPPEVIGSVDRVLLIRALHNLNRLEAKAGALSQALSEIHRMLKDDGLVGVVQHRAQESTTDEWASGSNGYLKQSAVIAAFEQAGFALVRESEINANPNDNPGPNDFVWRLPPSLSTSKKDPDLRATMVAIGESDRMTLLFRKAS